jgi:hypothetical protein
MQAALDSAAGARLVANGFAVAVRHDWASVAQAHLGLYAQIREACHA